MRRLRFATAKILEISESVRNLNGGALFRPGEHREIGDAQKFKRLSPLARWRKFRYA
jgi:hypothetical protein